MPDSKQTFKPRLAWIVSVVILSWLVLVPQANRFQLRFGENQVGVVSLASIENISPYTDYFKYVLICFTPAVIAVLLLNFNRKWIELFTKLFEWISSSRIVWSCLSIVLVIAWLINTPFNQFKLDATLIDSFHQGEFLGFLPDFIQLENPFKNTVLIHGWGLDVFPSWVASQLVWNNNGIVLTRLFVNLENVIGCLGYFWIFWELTGTVKLGKFRLPIFLISCLCFCIFDGIFFKFDGRRGAYFMLQIALMLRFFRQSSDQRNAARFLALVIGVSLPFSFLYVYDRAIYFLAVYLCASVLSFFLGRSILRDWFFGSILGVFLSSVFVTVLIGFDQVLAILKQIVYWGKYGRYISFIPLPSLELTWISVSFWLPILIQAVVLVYLVLDFKVENLKIRPFIQKNYWLILLLSAAGVYMRITLDRSDLGHAYHGAIPTVFLVAYLSYLGYEKYVASRFQDFKLQPDQKLLIICLVLVALLSEPGFNPVHSARWVKQLPDTLSQPDAQIVKSDYLQAWTEMQPEIDQQSCFFSLTSEGLWYYLFDKPACSSYSYVLYAKPQKAQEQVIQELEQAQPQVILLSNEMWFENPWDKVLKSESAALIYQNILQRYRPYRTVQSHWFWKRSDATLNFTQTNALNGFVETESGISVYRNERFLLRGWAIIPEKSKAVDAVYLTLADNQPIATALVNQPRPDVALVLDTKAYENSGWTLRVPVAILPLGRTTLKVWAYDAEADQLVQIDKEITLQVIP